MLGNESLEQFIDAIGHDPSLRCPFLSCGVAPFEFRCEDPLRSHTGLMKGDTPEDPESGAHEAFFEDLLDVAAATATFDANTPPTELRKFFAP